eukprot:TRINITY_DN12538_c0_g1_i1.p1 TRINITY_DN12538_c0_g1~~TRINITY_DN12538_c0_g1_i1.p1  ORF type:complete len:113 (-),score=12.61 TRINITY_DN12538_c0_g1_i1:151-489(-)
MNQLPEYSYTLKAVKGFQKVAAQNFGVEMLVEYVTIDQYSDLHCCFIMEVAQSKKLLECFKKCLLWSRLQNKMKLQFRRSLNGELVQNVVSLEFSSQVLFFINECLCNVLYC